MWKFGDKLYYAQLKQEEEKPPVARIIEATYYDATTTQHVVRIKAKHTKYPLKVKTAHLGRTPDVARIALMLRISNAVESHHNQIVQLWEALSAFDQNATVVWPAEKIVRRKELPVSLENTTINTLAPFKQNPAMQASRDRVQASLIAAHQRRRGKNPPRVQHVPRDDPRQLDTELALKIVPLLPQPEEPVTTTTPTHQPPPIDPTSTRPIPLATHENDTTPKVRPTRKPPNSSK
jgi:hypothetical protein